MQSPILIEFAGLPAAGKTTTARNLKRVLSDSGWVVQVIPEPGLRSPLQQRKREWMFNAWTLCQTVTSVIEATNGSRSPADVVILDRGLIDAMAWIGWYADRGDLTASDADIATQFALFHSWFDWVRYVFVLIVGYETACERRQQLRPGQIVNPDTMRELAAAYTNVSSGLRTQTRPRTYSVDTSDLAADEVLKAVLRMLCDTGLFNNDGKDNVSLRTAG